jgi:leader peptidase (prepilin peptidase)/N-methyltransferase
VVVLAAVGAVASGLVIARVGWQPALPGLLVAVLAGMWLAAVDLRVHRLPATVVHAATATVVALLAGAACVEGEERRLVAVLAGAAGLWLVYRVVAAAVGGVGAGDVRLAGLLGAVGGWAGWHGWAVATVLPFAVFAAVGAIAWAVGWRERGQPLPFGPAMTLGLLAAICVGG